MICGSGRGRSTKFEGVHALLEAQLHEARAVFAGEVKALYSISEISVKDSSCRALLYICAEVNQSGKQLIQLVAPL